MSHWVRGLKVIKIASKGFPKKDKDELEGSKGVVRSLML